MYIYKYNEIIALHYIIKMIKIQFTQHLRLLPQFWKFKGAALPMSPKIMSLY